MQSLNGKTAFITGGSKGIGYGIAEALLKEGVNVAITSRSEANAQAAAQKLAQVGSGKVLGLEADVRNMESQAQAVRQVTDQWGPIDFVIANAGLGHFAPVDEMTPEQWHETIDTNLTGVFYTLKASVDSLKATEGYFITISSLAGTNFFAQGAAYNASKFGLTGFTQAAMLDLRKYGIRTSTIMPGSVATHFADHQPDPEKDAWKIQIEDLGQMVVDLLKLNSRTLPSKIEVRPSIPPSAR